MTEFEKNARQQLHRYASPVDSGRLWAQIEQDLQRDKRRPKLFWISLLGMGLFVAAVAAWYLNMGNVAPAPQPAPAPPSRFHHSPVATNSPGNPGNQAPPVSTRAVPGERAISVASGHPFSEKQPGRAGSPAGRLFDYTAPLHTLPVAAPPTPQASVLIPATDERRQEASTMKHPATLPALPILNKPLPLPSKEIFPAAGAGKTDCPRWRKNRGVRLYAGLYGGAQYPLKTLTAKTAEFDGLAQRRTDTETVLEGVSVGGYLGLKHWSGISLESGLEYNRLAERFDLKSIRTDTIGRIGITGVIVNAPGDTTFIQDSVFVVEETRSVKQTFNSYRFLQLPIALGYEWSKSDRWSFYVKAGAALNLRFRQKAEMINANGVPEKFVSESPRPGYPFRSGIGLSPFVNLGTRYRLANGLGVFAEVRYMRHSRDITTTNYPVRQRYDLPGVNLGIQIHL